MKSLLLFVLSLTATALWAGTGDEAAIRAARLAQNAAIAAHDLPGIAATWTDNVIIQRGLGKQAIGKEAYLQLFRDDATSAGFVYERKPDAIEVSPDWPLAFETGHWEGRQQGVVLMRGKYTAHWVKRGDKWLIRGEVYVALEAVGEEGKKIQAVP